jgi:hypothetical protein
VTPQRLAALGFLIAAALRTGGAQAVPEVRVEIGRAQVRQRGYEVANAALLALAWRQPMKNAWTLLSGANLTYAQDSLAAAQGVAALAIPWPTNDAFRSEIGLAAASFSLRSSGRGGSAMLFGRQHYVREGSGAWAGGGYGRTNRDGVSSWSGAVDAGVWTTTGPFYFSAALTRHNSSDWPLLLASGVFRNPDDERYDLLDGQLVAQARNGPHDFTVFYGERHGIAGTEAEFRAFGLSGTLQLTERFALLGSGGKQLADPLRGLPQADLFTISARVTFGPKPLPVMQRSMIATAEVLTFQEGGGVLMVRVFASDTTRVEIAGDFTTPPWEPIRLDREGPFFVARLRLNSGKYRISVRVNEGEWRAPRNLARVRDDFGGEAGIVVIP